MPATSANPLDHAHKYLTFELLTRERVVTRRHVVQHAKRVFRSIYGDRAFNRDYFQHALLIAEREIAIAAFIPADQVAECVARFRLSTNQPMGRKWSGECYGALANAISNVHRLSPEFFSVPMQPTENSAQIEAFLKSWKDWQAQQTSFAQAAE